MKFPRYPSYRDSGVAWLGDVPAHWQVSPCRAIVHEQTAKNEGAACTDYLSLMANVGIIPYAEKGDVGNKKPEDVSKCKIVARGDLVINSMNYGIGSYGLSGFDGICSPVYIVLKPHNDVVQSRFAFRIFENRAFQTFAQSFGNGILEHRCAINWDILKGIGVVVPPPIEQKAILAFLDWEAAKIDELVAEQEQLIALLKEKRQAVIANAVTKGLHPYTPMRPSGVEWLGDVPAHWDVCQLKRVFRSVDYGISDSLDSDGSVAILRMGNIVDGRIVTADLKYAATVDSSLLLESGDLLYNRTNSLDLIGKVGMFVGSADNPVSFASYLVRLRLNGSSVPDYFAYLLNTDGILGIARSHAFVAIGQCNLNPTRYGRIVVAVPPRAEQIAISDYLNVEMAKLDALTAEAQRAIHLLQERRTALIAAAVTGQMDVRDLVESEAA
jgi:type I restriction enzyme S subunit